MPGLLTRDRRARGSRSMQGQVVPLREDPLQDDGLDRARIEAYQREYDAQTDVLIIRDRQIEYNIRMLCGQQWNVWNSLLGRFQDVVEWLDEDQKKWRQLPVINRLLKWYVSTHTRLTENPPILTWVPGPDRIDQELAEVMDALVKLDWKRANMEAVHAKMMTWLVCAGRAHIVTRIDLNKGEWKPWIAEERLPMIYPDGTPMVDPNTGVPVLTPQAVPDMPIKADGTPNAVWTPDGPKILGKAHFERKGGISCDAFSPLQVRAQWGPQLWHDKQWHCVQRFLTPEQVFEHYGVEVEPDMVGDDAANIATIERVLYGSGFYGLVRGVAGATGWPDENVKGELCTVYERWERPLPFNERLIGSALEPMMETKESPGGRHMIWTPNAVVRDSAREVRWPNVSPVRCWDFLDIPGRPSGTTPLEMMLSPQRSSNKRTQQIDEHAAVSGSPQRIVYDDGGIDVNSVDNSPTKVYLATRSATGGPAIEWSAPPALSADVYRARDYSDAAIEEIGMTSGTGGEPPTDDPSGELVKELRFDEDRYLGDTSRRAVGEYGRLTLDWKAVYQIMYDEEDIITINGEDNLARTLVVMPYLFKDGVVDVQPDVESMMPEGRGQRQARAYRMWKDGAWGDPNDPKVRDIFLTVSRFPSYGQLSRPGGEDRVMAEQENGRLLAGAPAVPIAPWQDDEIHLWILEKFMKSPEFWKQRPEIQKAFEFHRMQHLMQLDQKMMQQAAQMMQQQGMQPPGKPGAGNPGAKPPAPGAPNKGGPASLPRSADAQRAPSGQPEPQPTF